VFVFEGLRFGSAHPSAAALTGSAAQVKGLTGLDQERVRTAFGAGTMFNRSPHYGQAGDNPPKRRLRS
jgi:hypothetical protein